MANKKLPLFYKSKPLFGFDIGHGSIKVAQLKKDNKKISLVAYGKVEFDPKAVKDGEIVDFDSLGQAAHSLMEKSLAGHISTHHIAASLPVLHSFSRIINLPPMEEKDVFEAVRLEAEQYIPVPINDLYLDYQQVEKNAQGADYLVAAAPKRVVDSYMKLFQSLGLELVVMEPSILSVTRTVQHAEDSDVPTLVIDCGSITTDLIIYHRSAVRVTGTIKFGGETITEAVMNKFGINYHEARELKTANGIDPGDKQAEIISALSQSLEMLTSEIKKVIQYFEERGKDQNVKVQQIIMLGGGANLPGFSTYLTSQLRIPTRLASVWENTNLDNVKRPDRADSSMYATVVGLALIDPTEVTK
jgi:type IV pilus assembly protein PilM